MARCQQSLLPAKSLSHTRRQILVVPASCIFIICLSKPIIGQRLTLLIRQHCVQQIRGWSATTMDVHLNANCCSKHGMRPMLTALWQLEESLTVLAVHSRPEHFAEYPHGQPTCYHSPTVSVERCQAQGQVSVRQCLTSAQVTGVHHTAALWYLPSQRM